MTNTNCLEGLRCPRCGSLGPYGICGETIFFVTDEGVEDHEDVTWDEASACQCYHCGCRGPLATFRTTSSAPEPKVHHASRLLLPDEVSALQAVVVYAMPQEQRHWQESGKPSDHIYRSLRILQRALARKV